MFNLIAQNRHVSSEFGFNALVRLMQYFFGTEGYSYLPLPNTRLSTSSSPSA